MGIESGELNVKSIPLDEIESHINQTGNTIIFEGNNIDKLTLYNNIFKPLSIPLFLDNSEFSNVHPDAVLNEEEATIDGHKNVVVPTKTTLIALYNVNGKIVVLQNDEPIEESVSKVETSRSYVVTDDRQLFVDDFKTDMDKLYSDKLSSSSRAITAAQQGDILDTIRKTFSVNGSYTTIGGASVNYVAGKAATDYILYSNTKGTHFYVLAHSQMYPAGVADTNNAVWTTGYKHNIRKNSTTNNLISWSPNTSALNLDSNQQYAVGASAGTSGIDLSFSYTWEGASAVTMQSTGDKLTGLATAYFYKSNGNALSSKSVIIGHGALIQATNKVLSFSASHQFRNEDVYSSGTTWYSTSTTNLSYSF